MFKHPDNIEMLLRSTCAETLDELDVCQTFFVRQQMLSDLTCEAGNVGLPMALITETGPCLLDGNRHRCVSLGVRDPEVEVMKFSSRRSLVSRWHLWRSCPVSIFHILWISMLTRCHARDVVICTTSETFGYAAQSDLFDFEEHKLRMAWFDTVDLIPLPDTGLI